MVRIALILTMTMLFSHSMKAQNEETLVKNTINQLFDGMRQSDTSLIRSAFAPDATMQTIVKNSEGQIQVRTDGVDGFVRQVGQPHKDIYDERITFDMIRIDGELAIAWTPYKFYVGETFSHCGVNAFQMVKLNGIWKILNIIDTRRKENCD
jgi:hypothetical protein